MGHKLRKKKPKKTFDRPAAFKDSVDMCETLNNQNQIQKTDMNTLKAFAEQNKLTHLSGSQIERIHHLCMMRRNCVSVKEDIAIDKQIEYIKQERPHKENIPYVMIKSKGQTWFLNRNYKRITKTPRWAINLEVCFIENHDQSWENWLPTHANSRPEGIEMGDASMAYWIDFKDHDVVSAVETLMG